jgi:hypothetical protein
MAINASHFSEVTNGYEQRSDGLFVHRGKMSVGPPLPASIGQAGDLNVSRGNNTGTVYFASQDKYIHFNGTDWALNPLLAASNVKDYTSGPRTSDWFRNTTANNGIYNEAVGNGMSIAAGPRGLKEYPSGATIATLPIGTADIAAGATEQRLGSFESGVSWGTPGPNAWYEVGATVTATFSNYPIRVEFSAPLLQQTVGAITYLGLGIDGAVTVNVAAFNQPAADHIHTLSGVHYFGGLTGSHRIGIWIYTSGYASFANNVLTRVYVTEVKR